MAKLSDLSFSIISFQPFITLLLGIYNNVANNPCCLVSFPDNFLAEGVWERDHDYFAWYGDETSKIDIMFMSDSHLIPPVRVTLWSAPRCLSSAFERSIRELKEVKVLYEPHQEAFYFGPERKTDSNHPTAETIVPGATFQEADQKLLDNYDGYDVVFAKNHAYFIEGRYENYTVGDFSSFKHTFMIRHPMKATPSRYKACKECNVTFVPSQCGFRQLYELFEVVKKVDPSPVVVDADDLLARPREMMEKYCSATGIQFQEHMLTWAPGVVLDWSQCNPSSQVWHGTAMNSSGFMKPKEATLSLSDYPEVVSECVHYSLPFYEALYSARTAVTQL